MLNSAPPNCMSGRGNKYPLDDFCLEKKGFTLEHRRVGNGFIIHYSELLLELPVCEYVQQRECRYLAALGVNENAILALICITVRSLQTDRGIMSLSWPQLWFSRPSFGILSSILGCLHKPRLVTQLSKFSLAVGHRTIKLLLLNIYQRCSHHPTVGFIRIESSSQNQIWLVVLKDTEFFCQAAKESERIQTVLR